MVDVKTHKAIWTYPDLQLMHDVLIPVKDFDVDFQRHNSATVVISRLSLPDFQMVSMVM